MDQPAAPILSHVDATPQGVAAAVVGGELAAALDRPLVLGHVAPTTVTVHPAPVGAAVLHHAVPHTTDAELDEARLRGLRLLHAVAAELPVDATVAVRTGGATHGLVNLVRERTPAVVVLGTDPIDPRGRAFRPRWQSVARAGGCPALLVGPDAAFGDGPVLAAYDGRRRGERAVLLAARYAALLGRPLVVARAFAPSAEPPAAGSPALDDLLTTAGAAAAIAGVRTGHEPPVRCVAAHGPPAIELPVLAHEEDACLVVVGAPRRLRRPAARRAGSTAAILRSGGRPVLVCDAG